VTFATEITERRIYARKTFASVLKYSNEQIVSILPTFHIYVEFISDDSRIEIPMNTRGKSMKKKGRISVCKVSVETARSGSAHAKKVR